MVQSLLFCSCDYDSLGRLIRQEIQTNDTFSHVGSTEVTYDVRNNVTKVASEFGGYTASDVYLYTSNSGNANASSYTKDNLVSRYKVDGSNTRYIDYTYDGLNRLTKKSFNFDSSVKNTEYTYYASNRGSGYTTTQIDTEKLDNTTYKYYYDKVGNITGIDKNSGAYRTYTYDLKNQLTKEVNSTNGITTNFTYDAIGNITKKVQSGAVSKTINYRYGNDGKTGWNNLLTGVDLSGNGAYESTETISYDAIGNPTTYLGASLSWYGRQLKSYSVSGTTINYTYDADGLRGSKTVPGIIDCTYHYVGGQLRYETRGAHKFYYFYDASGNLSAIRYYNAGGTAYNYYALTNAQGDVVAFYNDAGTCVVTYEYDAWGNVVKTTDTTGINFAELNPIRYRGYYYDTETGLYYLQSRYYNPKVGRFLNADGYISTGQGVMSNNMFAYCMNNPVIFTDDSGARPIVGGSHKNETEREKKASFDYMRALSKSKTGNEPYAGDIYSLVTDLLSIGVDGSLDIYEYCVITGAKPNNIGWGTFIKQQNQSLSNINKMKSISSKASAYSAVISPTISVVENAYINYSRGASTQKIIWDATVDSSYFFAQASLCIITSLTICSVITAPVVASLVCFGASYMICYGMDMIFYDKFSLVKTLVQ